MSECDYGDARKKADRAWRQEITKYLPQLSIMSFAGPEATIRWLMDHVDIKPEDAQLANHLKEIEASEVSEADKEKARLEAIFPNLAS